MYMLTDVNLEIMSVKYSNIKGNSNISTNTLLIVYK
jgi:hypothetical protein